MKSFVYIDGWKSKIRFSAAHIIPEYEKCGRLHGHTYAVHAKIYGKPDDKGIIIDFSVLKETLKNIVKKLDHRILIPEKNSFTKVEKENNEIQITSLGKKYEFPLEDCLLLPLKSTSAENLSKYILERIVDNFTSFERIETIEIGVDEGFGQGAKTSKDFK